VGQRTRAHARRRARRARRTASHGALPRIIQDSGGGYVDSEVTRLVDVSRNLLQDAGRAAELERKARAYARERFAIGRFASDWNAVFNEVVNT
jgi:glycosyltransferase involved in cell wall biosynthesis